jgi:hypothetical protein
MYARHTMRVIESAVKGNDVCCITAHKFLTPPVYPRNHIYC